MDLEDYYLELLGYLMKIVSRAEGESKKEKWLRKRKPQVFVWNRNLKGLESSIKYGREDIKIQKHL